MAAVSATFSVLVAAIAREAEVAPVRATVSALVETTANEPVMAEVSGTDDGGRASVKK